MPYATTEQFKNDINLQSLKDALPEGPRDGADAAKDAYWLFLLQKSAYKIDRAFWSAGYAVPVDPTTLLTNTDLQDNMTAALRRWNEVLAAVEALGCKEDSALGQEAARICETLEKVASGDTSAIPGLSDPEKAVSAVVVGGAGTSVAEFRDILMAVS